MVWLARPRWTFAAEVGHFTRAIAAIGVIALALILALDLVLTRRWAGLLRRLRRAVQSLSSGDLSARAEVSGSDEFALLAQSLNEMRRRLLTHTETIDQQRQTLESLLDQLQEGVIAAGGDGRIILHQSGRAAPAGAALARGWQRLCTPFGGAMPAAIRAAENAQWQRRERRQVG